MNKAKNLIFQYFAREFLPLPEADRICSKPTTTSMQEVGWPFLKNMRVIYFFYMKEIQVFSLFL